MKHISKSITESIIGKRGNTGNLKGMLREFDIVTVPAGKEYLVIFDKDIIYRFLGARSDARPGILLSRIYPVSFMLLGEYDDNLILDKPDGSPWDIVEIYRNPNLDPARLKKDILGERVTMSVSEIKRSFYKKIWERR